METADLSRARSRGLAIALAIAATLTAGRPAVAQEAEAEALFQDGRRLLKEGKIAEACLKLDASEKLDGSVGTLLNLADCRERNGQIATAWATFVKAAAAARRAGDDGKREKEAVRRARLLEPRLSYLTVSVPETSQVEGLTIQRGDEPLDAALWNTSVPVDAGAYQITAKAPGREPWSTQLTVAEGQHAAIEVPRFKSPADLAPAASAERSSVTRSSAASTATVTATLPATTGAPIAAPTFTRTRWIAVGVGAAGVIALGGAVARGLASRDLARRSDAICPPGAPCDDALGLRLNHDARAAAVQTNVLIASGGALVVGAAVLWYLGGPPRQERPSVEVGAQVGGDAVELTVAGRF